jgi:hypothetical protein
VVAPNKQGEFQVTTTWGQYQSTKREVSALQFATGSSVKDLVCTTTTNNKQQTTNNNNKQQHMCAMSYCLNHTLVDSTCIGASMPEHDVVCS